MSESKNKRESLKWDTLAFILQFHRLVQRIKNYTKNIVFRHLNFVLLFVQCKRVILETYVKKQMYE